MSTKSTNRQTRREINSKIQQARQDGNTEALAYWLDIAWMARRRSMRDWSVEDLQEQLRLSTQEHGIAVELLRVA